MKPSWVEVLPGFVKVVFQCSLYNRQAVGLFGKCIKSDLLKSSKCVRLAILEEKNDLTYDLIYIQYCSFQPKRSQKYNQQKYKLCNVK